MSINNTLLTVEDIYIDFSTKKYERISVTQYDKNGHVFKVHCMQKSVIRPINAETENVRVKMMKPDGNPVINDCEVNEDGTVLLVMDEQMCAASGDAKLQLMLSNAETGDIVHTKTIIVNIDESTVDNTTVSSSYEFDALNSALIKADEGYDTVVRYSDMAKESEENAKASETNAKTSETNAHTSELNAKASETSSKTSENNASDSAISASKSEANASTYANNSSASASISKSYAVGETGTRENENIDNAKYYAEQAERIAEGLEGALIPMGTISFSDLQNTSIAGYMYNINDEFTTTDRFKEGAGNVVPAGTNVYYTADGFWDCMAGSPVTGIKGNAESSYRRGNVNITPENIGLGNVPNVATNDQTPTFAEEETLVNISSGENLTSLFSKIKKAISTLISHISTVATTSNVGHVQLTDSTSDTSTTTAATPNSVKNAYDLANTANTSLANLENTVGSADISGIGDGTCTGAISTLNSDLTINRIDLINKVTANVASVTRASLLKVANINFLDISVTIATTTTDNVIFTGLTPPTKEQIFELNCVDNSDVSRRCIINSAGEIVFPYALINGMPSGKTIFINGFYI